MTVSALIVIDSVAAGDERADRALTEAASLWSRRKREVTVKLSGDRARQIARAGRTDLVALLKSQDVGYWGDHDRRTPTADAARPGLDWPAGVADFLARQTDGYESVAFLAGRVPSSFGNETWTPQSIGGLAQWGVRAYLGKRSFLLDHHAPFYFGGRLHLASLGPNWIDIGRDVCQSLGAEGYLAQISHRVESFPAAAGGVICIRLLIDDLVSIDLNPSPRDAAPSLRTAIANLDRMLDRLISTDGLELESARQIADRYADISYEHAVPLEDLKRFAAGISENETLAPVRYQTGYLTPAELLYLFSAAWLNSHEKGKLVRNVVWKSPLGPATFLATDNSLGYIPAADLPATLAAIVKPVQETEQLPSSVTVAGTPMGLGDLLATLAAGFKDNLAITALPVRRGRIGNNDRLDEGLARECWRIAGQTDESDLQRQLELARCQLWTYKPVAL